MKNTAKRYNTQEVIAAACALYRINGNAVVKDNDKKLPTSKQLLVDYFVNNKPFEVTEVDREFAVGCIAQIQHRVLMNHLTDRKTTDFLDKLSDIVIGPNDVVSEKKFGYMVWVPAVVSGMQAEEQQKLDLAHLVYTSKYQGKLGEKIAVNFTPIRVKYAHSYSCWRYFGHDGNGNLIGFLSKKELKGKIQGKVKSHEVSKYNGGGRVTYLNYVKEIE